MASSRLGSPIKRSLGMSDFQRSPSSLAETPARPKTRMFIRMGAALSSRGTSLAISGDEDVCGWRPTTMLL